MPTLNELLHAASRTFAIGIDLLPVPLRDQVEVAYLLLRVSDFLEDNISMEPARKVELLKLWAGIMDGHDPVEALAREVRENREETPDALVARNLEQIEAAFRTLPEGPRAIVGRHVRDSTLGMARWPREVLISRRNRTSTTTCTRWPAVWGGSSPSSLRPTFLRCTDGGIK